MAKFVGDDVARDVWKSHRLKTCALDADNTFRGRVKRPGERDEVRISEQDRNVAGWVTQRWRDFHRAGAAEDGTTEQLQSVLGHRLHQTLDLSEAKTGADVLQRLVPKAYRFVDEADARIVGGVADDHDRRGPTPRHAELGMGRAGSNSDDAHEDPGDHSEHRSLPDSGIHTSQPPSTVTDCPVMFDESSDTRNSTALAMSCATVTRLSAISSTYSW